MDYSSIQRGAAPTNELVRETTQRNLRVISERNPRQLGHWECLWCGNALPPGDDSTPWDKFGLRGKMGLAAFQWCHYQPSSCRDV